MPTSPYFHEALGILSEDLSIVGDVLAKSTA